MEQLIEFWQPIVVTGMAITSIAGLAFLAWHHKLLTARDIRYIVCLFLILCLAQVCGISIGTNGKFHQPVFSGYTPFQWIFQIAAWVALIPVGMYMASKD